MTNDWKARLGMVYSTNPNFKYDTEALHTLSLLINNGINGNCRLTGLSVTDDQLTLSSSDGHHGVNCLNTCL